MAKKPLKSIQFAGLADTYTVPVVIEETGLQTLQSGAVLETVMTPSELADASKSGLTLNVRAGAGENSVCASFVLSAMSKDEDATYLIFYQSMRDSIVGNNESALLSHLTIAVDASGTMTVVSYDEEAVMSKNQIVDMIYPVGSIYISMTSTSPSTLFGGSWTRIQGRFLLAADSTYTAGSTGGEATHTLTVDEMPSHQHTADFWSSKAGNAGYEGSCATNYDCWNRPTERATAPVQATGGGQAHNNMPPYLAVYMWQRTA